MRRSRLLLLALLAAAIAPAAASAACPTGPGPVWAEHAAYGVYNTPVERILARPGTVLGVQNETWRDSYQAAGADTAGWYMQLPALVGGVFSPKPKAQVLAKVPALVSLANRMTTCDEPWLALNEMLTVHSREPLGYSQRRFRENVLALAKALHEDGVHVFLLMPRIPLDRTRYRTYWRQLSLHTDLVYEAYTFNSREVIKRGDAGGTRYLRLRWAGAIERLKKFVVAPSRAGLMIPYWTHNKGSGREGLSDNAWFRLTRIKTRAATTVGTNHGLGSLWSWGWQTNRRVGEVDPDKPKAACHYLNERDPALCDPASL
ncbi:MAG TPA: hypothetical protein VD695_08320 [Gaiellaceae bacterium]|nr:hypothetical protein [Gaiellaceae bacterium]